MQLLIPSARVYRRAPACLPSLHPSLWRSRRPTKSRCRDLAPPQLLIGLDLMRKYQAVIDLGRNAMLIGGKAIPFVEGDEKKRH